MCIVTITLRVVTAYMCVVEATVKLQPITLIRDVMCVKDKWRVYIRA